MIELLLRLIAAQDALGVNSLMIAILLLVYTAGLVLGLFLGVGLSVKVALRAVTVIHLPCAEIREDLAFKREVDAWIKIEEELREKGTEDG